MSSYLVVKNFNEIKSIEAKTSEPAKPYIKIKEGYFPLTTETSGTGIKVKGNGATYKIVETQSTTTTIKILANLSFTETSFKMTDTAYCYKESYKNSNSFTLTCDWELRNTTQNTVSAEFYFIPNRHSFFSYVSSVTSMAFGKLNRTYGDTGAFAVSGSANWRTDSLAISMPSNTILNSRFIKVNPTKFIYEVTASRTAGRINLISDPLVSILVWQTSTFTGTSRFITEEENGTDAYTHNISVTCTFSGLGGDGRAFISRYGSSGTTSESTKYSIDLYETELLSGTYTISCDISLTRATTTII